MFKFLAVIAVVLMGGSIDQLIDWSIRRHYDNLPPGDPPDPPEPAETLLEKSAAMRDQKDQIHDELRRARRF
jgi:hypothetical protein